MSQQPGSLKGGVRPPQKSLVASLIPPALFAAGSVYLVLQMGLEKSPYGFPAVGAGLLFGTVFMYVRFRSVLLFLAIFIATFLPIFVVGALALGWNCAAMGGMLAGIALREAQIAKRRNARVGEWFIGYRGFSSVSDAWMAAMTELRAMEGGRKGMSPLLVEHGSAHLQFSGSTANGFYCHRNPNVDNQDGWALMIASAGGSADPRFSAAVPNGETHPVSYALDIGMAEKALNNFLANPYEIPGPPQWETGIPQKAVPRVRW